MQAREKVDSFIHCVTTLKIVNLSYFAIYAFFTDLSKPLTTCSIVAPSVVLAVQFGPRVYHFIKFQE